MKSTTAKVCAVCLHMAPPRHLLPGRSRTTAFLLVLGILPGVLYEAWRRSRMWEACPECLSHAVLAPTTKMGRTLARLSEQRTAHERTHGEGLGPRDQQRAQSIA